MSTYFFGGAFDPVTTAHIGIVRWLLRDEDNHVILAVTDHNYKKPAFTLGQRLLMLQEAMGTVGASERQRIEYVVQDRRTWDYFQLRKWQVTESSPVIVVGADEMRDLFSGRWHNADALVRTYRFLVMPRDSEGASSTRVRKWLEDAAGECVVSADPKLCARHMWDTGGPGKTDVLCQTFCRAVEFIIENKSKEII